MLQVQDEEGRLFGLPLRDLGGLDGGHFLGPALGGLGFLDGAEVVGGEAGDAHVVVAFEDELDVADLEGGRGAQFGETAGGRDDVVDEVVGHLEDELSIVSRLTRGKRMRRERKRGKGYLFSIRSETLAFAAAGDLADEDVEHFLAEDALALAFEDVARVFLDGGLAHHAHAAVAGPAGEGGARRGHGDGLGERHVEVLGDGHVEVAGGVVGSAVHGVGVVVGALLCHGLRWLLLGLLRHGRVVVDGVVIGVVLRGLRHGCLLRQRARRALRSRRLRRLRGRRPVRAGHLRLREGYLAGGGALLRRGLLREALHGRSGGLALLRRGRRHGCLTGLVARGAHRGGDGMWRGRGCLARVHGPRPVGRATGGACSVSGGHALGAGGASLMLRLEGVLLVAELLQKLTTLAVDLLSGDLPGLEFLEFLLGHRVTGRLTVVELLTDLGETGAADFLFLKRDAVSKLGFLQPALGLLVVDGGREEEVQRVDFLLDLGEEAAEGLRRDGLGTWDGLALLGGGGGLELLLLLQLAVLLKGAHTLHQILRDGGQSGMRRLVVGTLGVAVIEDFPEVANHLGVLGLLLVGEMWELLHLIGPDQVGVLRHHRLGPGGLLLLLRGVHVDRNDERSGLIRGPMGMMGWDDEEGMSGESRGRGATAGRKSRLGQDSTGR